MRSLRYLFNSAIKTLAGRGFECPSCRYPGGTVIDRKYLVTSLRRCGGCHLLYRTPTTTEAENAAIYQTAYTEGFTTELPDLATLTRYRTAGFAGTEKDYRYHLDVLAAVGGRPGQRVYDFGCSWGYGSYQIRMAGYRTDSYEISKPRAAFAAAELGVTIVPPEAAEEGGYDVFFSSHVIEHVPVVEAMIGLAGRLLKPGGVMLTFTPNGGDEFRRVNADGWHHLWGFVHPQLVDRTYLEHRFRGHRYLIGSTPLPLEQLAGWVERAPLVLPLDGVELVIAVRKPDAAGGF